MTGTGTINVLVDDVNDNVPTFASNMHFTAIPEDAPTGTDVLLVNASDADAAANAVIRYVCIWNCVNWFSPDLVFKLTQNDIQFHKEFHLNTQYSFCGQLPSHYPETEN